MGWPRLVRGRRRARRKRRRRSWRRRRPMVRLAPVNVAFDRIIRTTIGLRPFRPSGFVLRTDKLDGKTIVHNFGHGGSGMSLSWGTASMADRDGDGAPGAQGRGHRLWCRRPDLGARITAARFRRHDLRRDRATRHHLEHVARRLHADLGPDRLPKAHAGVGCAVHAGGSLLVSAAAVAGRPEVRRQLDQAIRADRQRTGRPTAPTSCCRRTSRARASSCSRANIRSRRSTRSSARRCASSRRSISTRLMDDFLMWGGKVVIRKFETPRDVASLTENVIVNCSGLGAKALFNDPELTPLKGQLVVLVPQSEITYGTTGGGARAGHAGRGLRAHDAALGRHHPRRHVDSRQLVARRRGEGSRSCHQRAHRAVCCNARSSNLTSHTESPKHGNTEATTSWLSRELVSVLP